MKVCKKCLSVLPYSQFYTHAEMNDGHLNFCKECVRERVVGHRNRNITRIRAYDRKRAQRPENIQRRTRYTKKFRNENPEKYKAHTIVGNAIRDGLLTKQPCEMCGSADKTHAHHEDYDKPLKVIWLCPACHSLVHHEE
jgi:hypothetical protein